MGYNKKLTLPTLFYHSVAEYSGKNALVFAGEDDYTYGEMGKETELLAEMLLELGICRGDKVAILSSNMPNWGKVFFAISLVGAVAVPVLPDFHEREIQKIIKHSEAKAIFVSKALYHNLTEETAALLGSMVLMENFALIPRATPSDHLDLLKTSMPEEVVKFSPVDVDEQDLASIIYTSGTTGSSKGVMLTHKNLVWTARQCRFLHEINSSDRFLSVLPLSHTFENTIGFLFPFMYGVTIHYLRKPPAASVLIPALQKVKPTKMLVVPLIIEKIYKSKVLPEFQKNALMRLLSSFAPTRIILHRIAGRKLMKTFGGEISFFGIGGSKLDRTVERFLKEANFPYAIGYGLTETSPLLAGAVGKNRAVGSTGIVLDGVDLRIADIDAQTGEGEIQAKGENVMKGYYKATDQTREVFTADGWFRTGDRGILDKDNRLFIKGRIKNMIVGASGENIYPEEIESVINEKKYVVESLVVEKKGKLVAMIRLNMEEIEENYQNLKTEARNYIAHKAEEILQDILRKVNLEVNKFSRINKVVLQSIPFERTPTQKIKRFLYS